MQAGQKIRDYTLASCIGTGDVGEVWLADHERLHKQVAIKFILPHLCRDPAIFQRFEQEAIQMAKLEHPNIIRVYDFFPLRANACLITSYIQGGSLRKRISRHGPLDLNEALFIARGILDALDFAHQQGVIHRDVKPSNILVTADSHAYLMDFGIALVLGKPRVTRYGTNVGTLDYMSPEQIRGETPDHHTDVYSFGCVFYEMLAGRPPFGRVGEAGMADFTIMHGHLKDPPTPLRQLNPEVDQQTEYVVMRALAKEPDKRFAGCGQMMRALPAPVGFTVGGRVLQKKTPAPRPKKTFILKSAAAVLALVAVIAAVGWIRTYRGIENLRAQNRSMAYEVDTLQQRNEKLTSRIQNLKQDLAKPAFNQN